MTEPEQIRLFSRWLEGTDIELLELIAGPDVIRLRRDCAGTAAAETQADPSTIPAPSVGLFRLAHPLRTAPLLQPGQHVQEGDPVGLLQIGELLVHVVAPHAGTVLDILARDGAAVGYGAALVRFARDAVQ